MEPNPAAAHPADLQRLGRYKIVRPLSKGGMALVYEARRESLAGVSPRVAIKLILPQHESSETFRELFINEARLGASMHHQNLVQIQDFDCDGDRYFLVMEYVEGLTLRRIISLCQRDGLSIPLGVIAEIGRQACDGLHYAHGAHDDKGRHLRLVHRDIKPSNLILGPHGVVKVLDFGISKGRLRRERQGSVKGTWGYMAPEQAAGEDVQPTADVFGLAVVLYELAALRPMFQEKGRDEIKRLLRDDHAARMAATLDPAYAPLVSVLIRALQRDPRARFSSAEAFGRALSALLPDPITARDEVTRFFDAVRALEEGAAPRRPGPRSQGSLQHSEAPSQPAAPEPTKGARWVWGALAAAGGSAGVLLAFVVLASHVEGPAEDVLVDRALPVERTLPADPEHGPLDEPAGPAGEGAPGEQGVRVVVRRPAVAEEPEEEPAQQVLASEAEEDAGPADAELSVLQIGSRQQAEVYIAGQFVDYAPVRRELPPGRYAVSIVALDGRRRTFEVELEAGQRLRRTWDFDRMEWR